MTPTDPAALAALAALTQRVTGLGTAVTLLAQQQANAPKADGPTGAAAAAQPQRPGSAGDADGGPLGKALSFAAGKVMAFLAPIVAVSNVLAQTISGFSVFTAAIKVLGATIAPLVLPFFVLLAAAIVAVSDEIWDYMLPKLKDWYTYILREGIPVMVSLVQAVRNVTEWIDKWARKFGITGDDKPKGAPDHWNVMSPEAQKKWKDDHDETGRLRPGRGGYNPITPQQATDIRRINDDNWRPPGFAAWNPQEQAQFFADRERRRKELRTGRGVDDTGRPPEPPGPLSPEVLEEWRRKTPSTRFGERPGVRPAPAGSDGSGPPGGATPAGPPAAPPPPPPPGARPPTPKERFDTALRDVIQSVRLSLAPPAQVLGSPDQISKQVQKDALSQDPLERRMRERSLQALEKLIEARADLAKIEENTRPQPEGHFDRRP